LASRSYEWCVTNRDYDNELDLLFDVRHLPDSIEMRRVDGHDQWFIWNETTRARTLPRSGTAGRRGPRLSSLGMPASARIWSDSKRSAARSAGDTLKSLFGSRPANAAIDTLTERVSTARRAGNLRVAPPSA